MDRHDTCQLAAELAQLVQEHLPCGERRAITIELGVGECDLAINDMIGAVARQACPLPGDLIARLRDWVDRHDQTACTARAQLRRDVDGLRCA